MLAETLALPTAFSHSGSRVLVLSATQDAARRLTESIGGTLNASKLTRGAVVDDFATRIRLGSEIISLPASQRQVRGYGAGVLLVILYEPGGYAVRALAGGALRSTRRAPQRLAPAPPRHPMGRPRALL